MPSSARFPRPSSVSLSLPDALPISFLLFWGALTITSWYGGLGPSLLAVALSMLLSSYFLLPPYNAIVLNTNTLVRLTLFTLLAVLIDRKSTRLISSHLVISYAVFCSFPATLVCLSFPTRRSSDLVPVVLGRTYDYKLVWRSGAKPACCCAFHVTLELLLTAALQCDCIKHQYAGSADAIHTACRVNRSEEHTSDLQSPCNLVCRLLLVSRDPRLSLFPYPTLFRSRSCCFGAHLRLQAGMAVWGQACLLLRFPCYSRATSYCRLTMRLY